MLFAFLPLQESLGQVSVAWQDLFTSGQTDAGDSGDAITLDRDGNVYVAGSSPRLNGEAKSDLIVIKYNPDGEKIWTSRTSNYDWYTPNDIAVDLNGNVYVASQSQTYFSFIKIRFDGQLLWERNSSTVYGKAVSIYLHYENETGQDPNALVTGYRGLENSYMYTTKYNPAGNVLWSQNYNPVAGRNHAVAMENLGPGYVITGQSQAAGEFSDYVTLRYDRDGTLLWEKRYDGSGGQHDNAYDLAVINDRFSERIIVTGSSRGTGGIDDCATIMYDGNGNQQWVSRYYNVNNAEQGNYCFSVITDGSNSYVTGRSTDDIVTIKYDFDGNEVWAQRYDGPANGIDIGLKLVMDSERSVYVLGRSQGESVVEYVIIKYNSEGDQVWLQRFGNEEEGAVPRDIAVERLSGRKVYVTGRTNTRKMGTIVYGDEGPDWANLMPPAEGSITEGEDFHIYGQTWLAYLGSSPALNEYSNEMLGWVGVSGTNTHPSEWSEQAWRFADLNVMKGRNAEYILNIGPTLPPGTYYYATRYGIYYPMTIPGAGSSGSSVTSYSYGGYSASGGGFWDGQNNISGQLVVEKNPDDPNLANNSSFRSFNLGEASNAFSWSFNTTMGTPSAVSTAQITEDAQDNDNKALRFVIEEYNGQEEWNIEAVNEGLLVEAGVTYDISLWMKADSDDRTALIYLGLPESGGYERPVVSDVELTTEWTNYITQYTATENDEALSMRLGIALNYPENEFATISIDNLQILKSSDTSTEDDAINPVSYRLYQNYPNPFNPATNIQFDLPESNHVTIEIYDSMGRLISILADRGFGAGSHNLSFNAKNISSGIYYYRMVTSNRIFTQKMVLIK